ncbi:hypothetical protein [Streptomyces sp. NPDC057336]|uniref:hypothetical protein n=1 Tax=Streptomyces sp. NPDC057336 TaxID=3346102 RepID=UPI003634DA34
MNADDPRMTLVECINARLDYEAGKNGIEIAEEWAGVLITALLTVRETRAHHPGTFPGFGEATAEETARRIVARLLDAGWRPPDPDCLNVATPDAP